MLPPPCVLDKCMGKHMCQTFVAKLRYAEVANAKMKEALVTEGVFPSAYAVVNVPFGEEMGTYLVITTSKPRDFDSYITKLKKAIVDKAAGTDIEWVRYLSVRLQRLFGWGGATTSVDEQRALID